MAAPYQSLGLGAALTAPAGTYVRVEGRFQPEGEAQAFLSGELVSGTRRLRVEGRVFDWRPPPGVDVEFWGRLEPGPLLRFHNGRTPGDARHPRRTPRLSAGDTVRVWLLVQDTSPGVITSVQGVTEDRRVFFLPKYRGPRGLVCLRGKVGFLRSPAGDRAFLSETTRCVASRR